MLKVGEIMSKHVVTVQSDASIVDAIELLVKKNVTGLPVVNEQKVLVGIISEIDVIQLLLRDTVTKGHRVQDYMTQKVISFSPVDDILKICEFFAGNSIRRVPIIDAGRLVGVVSRRDVIKFIFKQEVKT